MFKKEPEVKIINNVCDEVGKYILKYLHNRKGLKALEIGCYSHYKIKNEIKGEIIILFKLAKRLPEVLFIGVDPKMPRDFIGRIERQHPNIKLYCDYVENLYELLRRNYEQFDLIYSVNVLHLVNDLNLHLQCIYNLLKPNGIFIAGWNLVGIPIAENIPKHKNQEIINNIHRYFKREHSAVYVYHEWNHYHVFLLLILKKLTNKF